MAEAVIIDAEESYSESDQAEVESTSDSTGPDQSAASSQSEEDEVEIEVEGQPSQKEVKIDAGEDKTAKLEETIRALQQELVEVSSRINAQARPEQEVRPPKEETLSKAQLIQILREAPDERKEEVLLNIMEYMDEQKTKEVKTAAFKELSESNWQREIAGSANQILMEDRDGYISSNPKVKEQIQLVKRNMRWDNHPAGDLAAYALIRFGEGLSATVKTELEKSKEPSPKTVNKGKMDKTRIPASKSTKLSSKITPEHVEMAKKLGVKDLNLMARFIP